jgi:hypothetical protein
MTTGAAALAESLALRRLLDKGPRKPDPRTVDVSTIAGIDIAEHPWEKMMAGKKPAPEPLATLAPHDHYYVAFKTVRALLDFGDLLDQWGGSVTSAYELNSRDQRVRQRYQEQLCLPGTDLARTLGPALVRSVAVTGSDPYVREGSDVTVLFHVSNRALFRAAVEPHLRAARKEFGARLEEGKDDYQGVEVESFVTPLREVSLHRAAVGAYVICSNSPAALRRVLDTAAGRRKALADSLDFRYMRTVFRHDDRQEDGFAFLSDAFIRQLVGPASKIKEKRRLEALASLSAATHAALFAAWETGRLPATQKDLLDASGLREEELDVPDGKRVVWGGAGRAAVSEVYNTLHFATPLIELPIDRVSVQEERDYGVFRARYLGLWRRYFDPVGMRFTLGEKRVRVETYILPLIRSSEYNSLRAWAGGGTTALDPAAISPRTLFQVLAHIAPDRRGGEKAPVGDWLVFRWDDGPAYRRLAEFWVRQKWDPNDAEAMREAGRLFCQLPMTFGIRIGDPKEFDDTFKQLSALLQMVGGPFKPEPVRPAYKGVTLTRVRFHPDSQVATYLNQDDVPKEKRFVPVFYHARVGGAWYASFSADALRDVIDRSLARREGGEAVQVNSSVYVAPEAAFASAGVLRSYLEWESHRRALGNGPLWYALYRGGVIGDEAEQERAEAAFRYLGFVPVSPDDTSYQLERRTDDVVNRRHGSFRRPHLHEGLADTSALAQLLDQLRTVRADLRFREDGVHTVVTIDRKVAGP